MAYLGSLVLLVLAFIWNSVKSQLNDTNTTVITTTLGPETTIFFTSVNPTKNPTEMPTTITPTSNPTETTLSPTYAPTIQGCTAIHQYIITTTNPQKPRQINSYPVGFGPFSYKILNTSIIGFPPPSTIDPCDISTFNQQDIMEKVVLLSGSTTPNCNYQEITLNLQQLGAKGLLIGINGPFFDYKGDDTLETPRIPTRFIDYDEFFTMQNDCCASFQSSKDVRVTLDCFNNSYPALLCVEDDNYGKEFFERINGPYEQQVNYDENGHPVWKQDHRYNLDSTTDWEIFFDLDTFNWVIGEITTPNHVVAFCNDTITDNPINCGIWYEKPKPSPYYEKSDTLMISSGLCPAGDPNKNTTNYCIRSSIDDLNGFTGTYQQLIEGIPEWFYENDSGKVAMLYWTEIDQFIGIDGFGWILEVSSILEAYCLYSDTDISQNNPSIRFSPILCTEWRDGAHRVDKTFDIDGNQCEMGIIDSNTSDICLEYEPNDEYTEWSGIYEIDTINTTINNHRVWKSIIGDKEYNIIYYEIGNGWIITQNIMIDDDTDIDYIDIDNIIAFCNDRKGLINNPTLCSYWIIMESSKINNTTDIIMTDITDSMECEVLIISTTIDADTTKLSDGGGSGAKAGLDFSVGEYIAIGAALLAFPICIVCFVCYQKQKKKRQHTDTDHGISLQPYVPTGMAYDSYKQNQANQQANKKKKTKGKGTIKPIKKPGPTAITSASTADGDDTLDEANSTNALINVFDEDENQQQNTTPIGSNENDENPFLRDDIIRTGHTIDEDMTLQTDIMNAFDE